MLSKRNYHKDHEKSKINWLPTIPKSPEYPVCKTYRHFLVDTIVLELLYMFVHADEQVYPRILHIIWEAQIPFMGGFHQFCVLQRVCWFWNNCCWIVGSVSLAIEGRQCRSMRRHKEGFDAFVQRRVEDITNKFELINPGFLNNLSETPSSKALEHVTNMKELKELLQNITSVRS